MAGWEPLWLGSHLHEIPWGKAALIRMVGAVLLAAGVLAVGLSAEDSPGRKRMLPWFTSCNERSSATMVAVRAAIFRLRSGLRPLRSRAMLFMTSASSSSSVGLVPVWQALPCAHRIGRRLSR